MQLRYTELRRTRRTKLLKRHNIEGQIFKRQKEIQQTVREREIEDQRQIEKKVNRRNDTEREKDSNDREIEKE